MPELVEQINELSVKMTEIGDAVQTAQDTATRAENKKGETDPAVLESITKASEAATKAVEELNEIKTAMAAHDKVVEYMEKAINRMSANDPRGPETSELEMKARDATNRYLRSGEAFPADVVEGMTKALISKSFFGVTDEVRQMHEKTMIAGVNPSGGYFIRPERSATMIKRIFETSPMRNVSNIETTSSDVLEFIIDDDVRIIKRVTLHEISLVPFPANELAQVSGFKSDETTKHSYPDVKKLDKRAIEKVLSDSGLFSSKAATYIASQMPSDSVQEPSEVEKALAALKAKADNVLIQHALTKALR